ncbi:MAG: hypothetical protein JRJ12_05925 [Deltaproteobacteria bacterium]|nr:hypothetical protein [Deltaproteobacteria bacterium]MBW2070644.1 hypothetical protein [Deltaproteobacteria bacterium]
MLEHLRQSLEEHNLLHDFGNCFASIDRRSMVFTTSCSYKRYKKFFALLYETLGPFAAEVSFDEDYAPEDRAYNTTVFFQVDDQGCYEFSLFNVLSLRKESSEQLWGENRQPTGPFEDSCWETGTMSQWKERECW